MLIAGWHASEAEHEALGPAGKSHNLKSEHIAVPSFMSLIFTLHQGTAAGLASACSAVIQSLHLRS